MMNQNCLRPLESASELAVEWWAWQLESAGGVRKSFGTLLGPRSEDPNRTRARAQRKRPAVGTSSSSGVAADPLRRPLTAPADLGPPWAVGAVASDMRKRQLAKQRRADCSFGRRGLRTRSIISSSARSVWAAVRDTERQTGSGLQRAIDVGGQRPPSRSRSSGGAGLVELCRPALVSHWAPGERPLLRRANWTSGLLRRSGWGRRRPARGREL